MPGVDSRSDRRYVITLGCPDRTGIVARIATFLAEAGGWIVEAGYHSDPDTGWFFTRQEVRADSLPLRRRRAARPGSPRWPRSWAPRRAGRSPTPASRKRAVLLVSKEAHCLHDLLGRVAAGELPVRAGRR